MILPNRSYPLFIWASLVPCLCPTYSPASDTGTSWLRLEQLTTEQAKRLDASQQEYLRRAEPLPPASRRSLRKRFTAQQQQQQLLQSKQQKEQSLLRQRVPTSPSPTPSIRNKYQLQRFRQDQQRLQNYQRMQRRSWPFKR